MDRLWLVMDRDFDCLLEIGRLSIEKVEEAGLGSKFFLENENAFVLKHPVDVGIWIVQIAEDPGTGGTRFQASGQPAFARSV